MATLGISDLRAGSLYVSEGDPWEVVEAQHVMLGRGSGHLDTKVRNLRTGNVLSKKFKQADKFEEAEVALEMAEFVYANKGKVTFRNPENPSIREEIDEERISEKVGFLTEGLQIQLIRFEGDVLGVKLPPKLDFRVTEADPWIKGDTAQGGTKSVTVETGMVVKAPPFIEVGDIIKINTETGQYTERVSKGRK